MKLPQPKAIRIDETHYILTEDYHYSWRMDGEDADNPAIKTTVETTITVTTGFRWDGASVPRLLWWLGFKPDGAHRAAALIHDFVYIHKGKLPSGSITANYSSVTKQNQHGSFSRTDADRLFGRMMKQAGVPATKRKLMKWGVTWFGWIYWEDGGDLLRWTALKTILVLLFLWVVYVVTRAYVY